MKPRAVLTGSFREPQLILHFGKNDPHKRTGRPLMKWCTKHEGIHWNWDERRWIVEGLGERPTKTLKDAGFKIDLRSETVGTDLEGLQSLEELVAPITKLSDNGRRVLVKPRLFGQKATQELLGWGAIWVKEKVRFVVPLSDLYIKGKVRPGIPWDKASLKAAKRLHRSFSLPDEKLATAAREASTSLELDDLNAKKLNRIQKTVGSLPAEFGLDLYGYQRCGAYGAAAGHRLIADAPGVGKTRTSLAVLAIRGMTRAVIVPPPLVLSNWESNVREALPWLPSVTIKPGRKVPDFPETGVIIVSDSLLAARPELLQSILEWSPDGLFYDEAHRAQTYGSARSEAILTLAAAVPGRQCYPITGTPILSSPAQLAPLLEMTGQLIPYFGSVDEFLQRYCTRDPFGRLRTRKSANAELRYKLKDHIFVRRTKDEVLPQLPKKQRSGQFVDIVMTQFRAAHKEVDEAIKHWITSYVGKTGLCPDDEAVQEYAVGAIGLISGLRRAAGVAKIPVAIEMVKAHVEATKAIDDNGNAYYPRPLIVWTHHREVTEAMVGALKNIEGSQMIIGGMSDRKRTEIVANFQANKVPVLAASITAAGVGITLTASSDVLFVEADWTPALVVQAEDRAHRIGQEAESLSILTLLAQGTLDERIHAVLQRKRETLDAILGGDNGESVVEDEEDLVSSTEIIVDMVNAQIAKLPAKIRNTLLPAEAA